MDSHYTPSNIAESMIRKVTVTPLIVADFSAGNGELLRAAENKWGKANYIATDIDSNTLRKMARRHPNWDISRCDFTNSKSRVRGKALAGLLGKISLILLNPPFSHRGNRSYSASLDVHTYNTSVALSFVITSLNYLSPNGELLAILPIGSLSSEKDHLAWEALKKKYHIESIATFNCYAFKGCRAKTVLVKFSQSEIKQNAFRFAKAESFPKINSSAVIVRGSVPMHYWRLNPKLTGKPFIHSTELVNNSVELLKRRILGEFRSVVGPTVLISRVGKPSFNKTALYQGKAKITLSDCVIGIQFDSTSDAKNAFRAIKVKWNLLKACYSGTCAPYITIAKLKYFLLQIGIESLSSFKSLQEPSQAEYVNKRSV